MRIAITGIGIVSALGLDRKETAAALASGVVPPFDISEEGFPVGRVRISSESGVPRSVTLGVRAAHEALTLAGVIPDADMALLSGTTVGGMDLTEQHVQEWVEGGDPSTILSHDTGATTEAIASALGTFGMLITPSTACSSAMNAILTGCNMLRTGRAKRVLAGGTECLTHFHIAGFASLMILDRRRCRPFAADRAGLNLGEGAAYLLLEDEKDAVARKATIYGYIAGYGNACDAYHQTASSENGEGAFLAMIQALKMGGVAPEDVQYVNAHGTGTQSNDASELTAMRRVFGEHLPQYESTKMLTGHTTSACGSVETVISLMRMQQHRYRYALCNSFGFGGNDSCLLIAAEGKDIQALSFSEDLAAEKPSVVAMRRLTPMMKATVIRGIEESGDVMPDAIITATKWGSMVNTVRCLRALNEGESMSPTAFMQSTHNTMSSTMAILTHNHGYNNTYSQRGAHEVAVMDAQMQIELGLIRSALILDFEEAEPLWNEWLSRVGEDTGDISDAFLLTANSQP